jgi:hypothetical protein
MDIGVNYCMKISDENREKTIEELLKAGAVRRENPSEYQDGSIGKKGLPIIRIKI